MYLQKTTVQRRTNMFGLKYVHGFFPKKSYPKLMKILDVKHKSTISNWISRGSIPEEYLPILEREFKVGREYLNKHLTSEEMKYVQYLILKNQYESEYEEAYFVECDAKGRTIFREKGITETEYSKHEKIQLYNQMKNKKSIMHISNWLNSYQEDEVGKVRWLLNTLVDFIGEDTTKVQLITQIVEATKKITQTSDVLKEVQKDGIPDDEFFDNLRDFIKKYYDTKSEF